MSWKAALSRHLPVVRFFACPKSPASRGVMYVTVVGLFVLRAHYVRCIVCPSNKRPLVRRQQRMVPKELRRAQNAQPHHAPPPPLLRQRHARHHHRTILHHLPPPHLHAPIQQIPKLRRISQRRTHRRREQILGISQRRIPQEGIRSVTLELSGV